eukprot:15450494-Alexandrium_andersonii.AAC.1
MWRHLLPAGATYVPADTVAHFAQAPEFICNLVRDGDVVTGACYVSVTADVGSDVDLRPPAGRY